MESDAERIKAFENLDIVLPPLPGVPPAADRLSHLFGATEAAACFRLPTPSIEGPPGLVIRPWRELPPPPHLPERGAVVG
jgi:hypothetical protein